MHRSFVTTERELNNIRNALDEAAIVAVTDRGGKITHVNRKFCEISKFAEDELLGKDHRIINSGFHPKEFFQDLWRTVSSGKIWRGEVKNRAKDGTFYWVDTTIVPFLDEMGSPYSYVAIRNEITQRKIQEEQLRLYAQSLEDKYREDRLASIGLLASGLAHEIGTPLGIIRGRSELLQKQIKENVSANSNIEIIIAQIERVTKLIKSLLNLARGNKSVNFGRVNLNLVASDVIEVMAHEFKLNNITVDNQIARDLDLTVNGEVESLHQVFLNLLVNAVQAINGAIQKQGRNIEHFIRLKAVHAGSSLLVTVEDSGCGISKINLQKIFRPFFTTKDVGTGTGLGLAICCRIVESWGGGIDVESEEGIGTTFQIRLPIVKNS